MQMSMFSSEELPASPSQLQDSEKDWMTRVATSCSPILPLLNDIGPSGWYGRTSPASYPVKEDEILPPYFEGLERDKVSWGVGSEGAISLGERYTCLVLS